MDNFKGEITANVASILEENNIHSCTLPPNTTDRLQPLDISVNKAAKSFLNGKFEEWYSQQVVSQLQGHSTSDIQSLEIQPIDLSLTRLKEVSAQ